MPPPSRPAVEVVADVEAGEEPCRPRESRQVVDVDEPLVVAVGEAVVERRAARVGHGAVDERRHRGWRQDGRHQRTPKDSAASTPERQPSSWKPQPRCAPAKARRSPPPSRRRDAASTASRGEDRVVVGHPRR